MSQSNTFYCLVALEYDNCFRSKYSKRLLIKDREWVLGENDNYGELYDLFVHLQYQSPELFFEKLPKDVSRVQVQLEKCQETKNGIECIQVENEFWVENPNYKGGI